MQTLEIQFPTASPINVDRLKGQNKKLFEWLSSGKTATLYDNAKIGIGYLNSRISDLRNKCGVVIYDRMVKIQGNTVKEYSLTKFQ